MRLWHLFSRRGPALSECPQDRVPGMTALNWGALTVPRVLTALWNVPAPCLVPISSSVVGASTSVTLRASYVRRRLTGELDVGMTMKLVVPTVTLRAGFRGGVLTTVYLLGLVFVVSRWSAVRPVGSMLNARGLVARLVVVVYRSVSDRGLVLHMMVSLFSEMTIEVTQTSDAAPVILFPVPVTVTCTCLLFP